MIKNGWSGHRRRYDNWNINDLDFIYVDGNRYRLNLKELIHFYRSYAKTLNRYGGCSAERYAKLQKDKEMKWKNCTASLNG